jgi:phenylpropionate dioxygenase-like ring-hydroxylating dioxygenase large terminal subunit
MTSADSTKHAPFLRNAWYMAAWSSEIGTALVRRRLLGNPVVMYRLENGRVAALTDRCPHRFAPLSKGERIGDAIQCGYHGLTFDAAGKCIRSPFADKVPNGAIVKSWPVVERDGVVWIWAGEDTAGDDRTVPDLSAVSDGSGVFPIHGHQLMRANYEYTTDNLMDLSHIEFVHKGSFAGAGVIFAGKHTVRQEGNTVHSDWWMPNVLAPAHTFGIYERDLRTDHWLDMHWQAPATMRLEIGAVPAGAPREQGCIVQQAHILTPETEHTTHYFWSTTRSSPVATPEGDSFLRALMLQAFDQEDAPIIEAAYANLDGGEFWAQKPVFIGVDAAGTRARRVLQAMINSERQSKPADTASPKQSPQGPLQSRDR